MHEKVSFLLIITVNVIMKFNELTSFMQNNLITLT